MRPARTPGTIKIGDDWCPDCGGEGRVTESRYGGNDPDTWLGGLCETCHGTCVRERYTPSRRRFRGYVPVPASGRLASVLTQAAANRRLMATNPALWGESWYRNMRSARTMLRAARQIAADAAADAVEMQREAA